MTPQERQMVDELFDKLARLEAEPRDREAERAIAEGLRRAPNAVYALVQTVLIQDEALRTANEHIEALERGGSRGGGEDDRPFLDKMRDAILGGGREPERRSPFERGGPSPYEQRERASDRPMGLPPGYRSGGGDEGSAWNRGDAGGYRGGDAGGGYRGQPGPGDYREAPQQGGGRGGSFLGTAAGAAAGMIGGGLLLDSLRGMLGGQSGSKQGAMDQASSGGAERPWGGGESGGGDLASQAGLNDIGRGGDGYADAGGSRGLFGGDAPREDYAALDHEPDDGGFFDLGDSDLG